LEESDDADRSRCRTGSALPRREQQLTATAPTARDGRLLKEEAMIGTVLIAVAALVIAVLGCAWAKPIGLRGGHHTTAADD
jgi:hypothetical protein